MVRIPVRRVSLTGSQGRVPMTWARVLGQEAPPAPTAATAPTPPPPDLSKTILGFEPRTLLTLGLVGLGAYWLFSYDPTEEMDFSSPELPKDTTKSRLDPKKKASADGGIFADGKEFDDLMEEDEDDEDEDDDELPIDMEFGGDDGT